MQIQRKHSYPASPPVLAVIGLLLVISSVASADDWPQWRGPRVDGLTHETLAPEGQHPQRLEVIWRKQIGVGFGTVSVHKGHLYVMGWSDGADRLHCLDPASGEQIWTRSYREKCFDNMHRGGPAATPAVDDEYVYTVSKTGRVHAFKVTDGTPHWNVNAPESLGVSVPSWGFSGSPILLGQTVIVDLGQIIAFDRATGRVRWRSDDFGAGYATPVPFRWRDQNLLAAFPARGLVVLDISDGHLLASSPWTTSYDVNAATPMVHKDQILITSGYGVGAALFRLSSPIQLDSVWKTKDLQAQMSSPVRVGDSIYGFDNGRFVCLDLATGHRRWMQRGLGKGSFVVAGEHLVVLSEQGRLVIAPVSPDGFSETTSIELFDTDQGWIMPVVAQGRIYCRSGDGELAVVQTGQ